MVVLTKKKDQWLYYSSEQFEITCSLALNLKYSSANEQVISNFKSLELVNK